jgi:hypothetical protein
MGMEVGEAVEIRTREVEVVLSMVRASVHLYGGRVLREAKIVEGKEEREFLPSEEFSELLNFY